MINWGPEMLNLQKIQGERKMIKIQTETRNHNADFKLSKQQTLSNYSYAAVSRKSSSHPVKPVYASLFAIYGP